MDGVVNETIMDPCEDNCATCIKIDYLRMGSVNYEKQRKQQ